MDTSQIAGKNVLSRFLILYRIISVFFAVIAMLTFLSVLSLSLRHFFALALMNAAYVGLNAIMAYGFWKMRKWIVPLLGGTTLVVAVINISKIILGTQRISQALLAFTVLGALFLFAYFSRKFLTGDYKNLNALGLFLAFLILSQAAAFFLK